MGECDRIHSITMKESYEEASRSRDYHFEEEVLDYLKGFLKDNERKIEVNKKRLDSAEDDPELERLVSQPFSCAVRHSITLLAQCVYIQLATMF